MCILRIYFIQYRIHTKYLESYKISTTLSRRHQNVTEQRQNNCDKEHTHSRLIFSSVRPAPMLFFHHRGILKDITPLYQEKPEYIILYKAPFYKKKTISAHKPNIF